jgi:hypothetical protein
MPKYNVNGQGYSFANLQLGMLGNPNVPGFLAVRYGEKVAKSNTKGAGGKPVERIHGGTELEASITLTMKEARLIRAAGGGIPLTQVKPFNVTVSYANGVDAVTTDIVYDWEFTEDITDASEGDEGLKITLSSIISGVDYGI